MVNTASLAGLLPMEAHAIYSSSKAAVVNLSEALARELAPLGFGVTILCPGQVPTSLKENLSAIRGGAVDLQAVPPMPMSTFERMKPFALASAEPVGVMVRNAILDNALYLHTATVPGDLVAERVNIEWGPGTVGRV